MNKFPSEINAWKNDVARRLVRLRGAVDDIWKGIPQIPDPEIGMPFTGPLSPIPFVFPPTDRSGGTQNTMNTGGTNTGGTLVTGCFTPPTWTMVAAGFSADCFPFGVDLNRTWNFRRNSALPCSKTYFAREELSGSGSSIIWSMAYDGANTNVSKGGMTYQVAGDVILAGVSFTVNYLSGAGACTTYPASLTLDPIL